MVYVLGDWRDRLPPKQKTEQDMLEFCEHVAESSRLSCQIKVTDILDGLRLELPKSQH
jgi:2Fe-2S ferredoxin